MKSTARKPMPFILYSGHKYPIKPVWMNNLILLTSRIIPVLFFTASITGTTSGIRNCRDTVPTKFQYIFSIKVSGRNTMESGHKEDQKIDDDNAMRLLLLIIIIIIALITRNILLRFVFDPVGFR
jgi:hypothetical protein